MKTIRAITGMLIVAAFLALGASQSSAAANNKPKGTVEHISMKVAGMYCQDCSRSLESSLCKFKGANNVKADYRNGMASLDVPASSKVTKMQLKKAVSNAGFALKDVKYSIKPTKP